MTNFYTSLSTRGDKILVRGYENGERFQREEYFSPTMFLVTDKPTGWKNIQDQHVKPISFASIRDARDWVQKYSGISNMTYYGSTNYVSQYAYDKYPGKIDFEPQLIRKCYLDIEVQTSEDVYKDHHKVRVRKKSV